MAKNKKKPKIVKKWEKQAKRARRDSPDYVSSFIDDLVGSDGSPNWVEASSGSYG